LVAKGYVKKMANKLDKRLVCVTITPKGLALLKKMDDNDYEIIGILNTVTDTEAKQLNKLLDKLRSAK
jgi:DNA-binding MarR family transcriptional regulator